MAKIGSKPIDELIRLAIIGDGTAFTALWDNHVDALKGFVRTKIMKVDDTLVDEICCYSFEKAFRHISDYDPAKSRFFTWLCNIAWNTALDIIDREKRARPRSRVISLDEGGIEPCSMENIADDVDNPLDSIIKDENNEMTGKYIDALPELYRDIARMRLIDGLQYNDISEKTGLELNTVRTRIKRAKAQIDRMKNDED